MKATAVLSGAQVVEALMSIVRAKVIAVLLGPVGMALNSIFQTTVTTLYQFASMGLSQSAVRDISKAYQDGDAASMHRVVAMFNKLMRPLALFSVVFCVVFSPLLSDLSFGTADNHTADFIVLSIGSACILLSYANVTVLQSTQRLLYLAKTTILGAVISLAASLPFYCLMGNKGVAWSISFGYLVTFLINSYYVKQLRLPKVSIPWRALWQEAAPMIKLGLIIMVSTIIINIFTYLTNVLLRYFGSLEDVGLYQAAYSLTNRNFAILSAALVADYYPRLSGLISNRLEFNKTVSEQGEMLLLVVSYVAMLLIVFAELAIHVLLSPKFMVVALVVKLIAYSFVFHVMWLTLSYIALAKGDKKVYLVCDAIIGNGVYFLLNILFYKLWGINGLGISAVVGSIFVSLLLLLVYGRRYDFHYGRGFWLVQLASVGFVSAFFAMEWLKSWSLAAYVVGVSLCGAAYSFYTYKALDKRIQISNFIKSKIRK